MSLLWRTAVRRTAAWEPRNSVEHIHPNELEGDYYPHKSFDSSEAGPSHRDVFGDREHIQRMTDDIRQHGYDPAKHGQLGLNVTDHGENLYNHAVGSMAHPETPHFNHEHLLQALKDSGHGEVPVHVHDQSSTEDHPAPKLYHGTTAEDVDIVHPNHGTRGNFGNNLGIHAPGYAYATSRESAESYANMAALTHGGRAHVYEVAPKGPIEKDPSYDEHGNARGNYADDMRSKHGFQVVGEEDLGHDEEPEDDEYGHDWDEHSDW